MDIYSRVFMTPVWSRITILLSIKEDFDIICKGFECLILE